VAVVEGGEDVGKGEDEDRDCEVGGGDAEEEKVVEEGAGVWLGEMVNIRG
jgi:hypothetical protein